MDYEILCGGAHEMVQIVIGGGIMIFFSNLSHLRVLTRFKFINFSDFAPKTKMIQPDVRYFLR